MPCLPKISQEGYVCEMFFPVIYNFSFFWVIELELSYYKQRFFLEVVFFTWSFVTVFKDKTDNLFLA